MKNNKYPSITKIVAQTLWKYKQKSFFLVLSIIGTIGLSIMPPLILEQAVNLMVEKKEVSIWLALYYFMIIAAGGLCDSSKEYMITLIGQKITHSIRSEMAEKMTRLPADYFVKTDSGVTVSRFINDVDTLERLFSSGIISMVVDVCKVVSILIVIFIKSKGLGILLVIVTPVLFGITRLVQKKMLAAQIDNRKAVGRATQHIPETLKNIRTIHVLHKEAYMEKRYGNIIRDSFLAMERSNFCDAVYSPIILIISAVLVAIMMVLSSAGSDFAAWFGMSVGTAVAVIAYVGKVFDPLEGIGMEIQNIQSAVAGVQRIKEFLQEDEFEFTENKFTQSEFTESKIENEDELQLKGSEPVVLANNISFGYTKDKKILEGFSCRAFQGENVTFFGRTGAGKSTLFKLILGLYRPQAGDIKVLGIEASEILAKDKRHLFGYAEQKFQEIPGTIEDQITLRDSTISTDMVYQTLKLIGMYDLIMQFPEKELTMYKKEMFSEGQIQLLSIARAIVADPKILLLDEITANLDSYTEEQVLRALKNASKNRTVLSISHRLYEDMGGRKIEI